MDDVTEAGGGRMQGLKGGDTQEPPASQATRPRMLHRCEDLFGVCHLSLPLRPGSRRVASLGGGWSTTRFPVVTQAQAWNRGSGHSAHLWRE